MPFGLTRGKDTRTRAIIDIGSNTVRLVVYGQPLRAPKVLHNEKVTARLGKGVAESGDLSPKAMALALASLARFKAILGLQGVTEVDVVATAASRDAGNGPAFLEAIAKLGLTPRLLSGEEEAITSAHGVLGAFPAPRAWSAIWVGAAWNWWTWMGSAAPMASACRWARCACPACARRGSGRSGRRSQKRWPRRNGKPRRGRRSIWWAARCAPLPAM
jgi:hypothetical protein